VSEPQPAQPSTEPSAPDPFRHALLDDGQQLEIILVRHGQQADRKVDDSPLSRLGQQQAQVVGEFLRDEALSAVYSSHLQRAHHTGLAIAGHHDLECVVDERLREIQIGRDVPDGKSMRDLIDDDELKQRGEAFIATRRWETFALSETGEELRARVAAAIDAICARHRSTGGDTARVVVACHGGVINAIVGHELGIPMDFFFTTAHCSVHRLRVGADRMVVESLNDTRHLIGEHLTY